MVKMHTRAKRKHGFNRYHGHARRQAKGNGARTFSSEERAKEWAKENGVTIASIAPAKHGKRFKILTK